MEGLNSACLAGLRIGILCGGHSPERPGSLASGQAAAKALAEAGYNTDLIDLADIDLASLRERIDIAFLGLHGPGGEDGKIQGTLETLRIPYTGSGVLASAIGMFKPTFKALIAGANIDTPRYIALTASRPAAQTLAMIEESLGWPVFIKPASGGGSLASAIAYDAPDMLRTLDATREHPYEQYMAEEYITGRPCTVGLLEIDGKLTALPVLEVQTAREFYDYTAKHDPAQRTENCPSALPPRVSAMMQQYALRAHRLVGAHGVSRVDFIAAPSGRLAMLEINTLPGLSARGNLATMAAAHGLSYCELITHVLRTAFTKPGYLP